MIDNRNMILAVVLSIAILIGFEMFFAKTRPAPPIDNDTQSGNASSQKIPNTTTNNSGPQTPEKLDVKPSPSAANLPRISTINDIKPRLKILEQVPRIEINTSSLHGTISLLGGRIDDLTLANYRETLDPNSDEILLLIPKGDPKAYYAEFGWVSSLNKSLPGPNTLWKTDRKILTSEEPVTLTWTNEDGLKFTRIFSVDDKYMFTVKQIVTNNSKKSEIIYPYGLISRRTTPEISGFYIIHEGLMGVADSTLKEIDYSELQEKGQIKGTTTGGWLGITDKYWMTALIPDQKNEIKTRYYHRKENGDDIYQVDYLSEALTVKMKFLRASLTKSSLFMLHFNPRIKPLPLMPSIISG